MRQRMRTGETMNLALILISIQRTKLNTEGRAGRKDIPCLAFKDIKNTFTNVQMPFISSPAKQGITAHYQRQVHIGWWLSI